MKLWGFCFLGELYFVLEVEVKVLLMVIYNVWFMEFELVIFEIDSFNFGE